MVGTALMLGAADAETFARCIAVGGVAVFPADTVYGLACEPDTREAVERLYALKGRRPDKPAAMMFFDLELAFAALPELEPRTRSLLERLIPGGITALLPNPLRRYPLACGPDPHTLGLRVPALAPGSRRSPAMRWPVMQSSANRAGGLDAQRARGGPGGDPPRRRPGARRGGAGGHAVDGRGPAPLRARRMWAVLRQGAVPEREIELAAAEA